MIKEESSGGELTVKVKTRYGDFFIPNAPDLIANSLCEYGEWAQAELDILCDFIESGDIVVDGGACYGTHARAFSNKVGREGNVICFEPAAENRRVLSQNILAAAIQNTTVQACALGSQHGMGHILTSDDGNQGASRLVVSEFHNETLVMRLDDVVDVPVKFIKLDLEGAELDALLGASRILTSYRPTVFSEVLDLELGAPILRHMLDLGYVGYGINTPAFRPTNFRASNRNIFGGATECGLLFVHSEEIERYTSIIAYHTLPTISTADDLFLLLSQQPQYGAERLLKRSALCKLPLPIGLSHVDFLTRELTSARECLDMRTAELSSTNDRLELCTEKLSNIQKELVERTEKLELSRESLEMQAAELTKTRQHLKIKTAEFASTREELKERSAELATIKKNSASHFEYQIEKLAAISLLIKEWEILNRDLLRLAKRVRAFPFGLYFRLNKRHRRSTRTLLRLPDQASYAQSLVELIYNDMSIDPSLSGTNASTVLPISHEEHPIGYKARILTQLYPVGDQAIQPRKTLPNVMVAAEVLAERTSPERGLLISFSHDNYLEETGGTQLCIGLEQQAALEAGFDYLHVFPITPMPGMAAQGNASDPTLGVSLNGTMVGVTAYQMLVDLARARGKNTHLILHQLLGHVPEEISSIIRVSKDASPIFWLHDFFALCQSPHLLRNQVSFCGAPRQSSMACGICSFGMSRSVHLARMAKLFESAPFRLVAPSDFVLETFRSASDLPYASLKVLPHMTLDAVPLIGERPNRYRGTRIAFIGAPVDHKGWPNFMSAFKRFGNQNGYKFYYFGVHQVSPDIISVSVATAGDDRDAMVRALREHEIDIVIHISPTPETFSFSVHEALAGGVSVVTNRGSGNTARVIESIGRGCVLDLESDLPSVFETGEIDRLAHEARERRSKLSDRASYSRMSMDIIAVKAP